MTTNKDTQEYKEQEILLSVDQAGVHIVSERVAEKLAKKNISASMIRDLENCPAKWAASTFAMPELIKEEPDNAARRGNIFHSVMEKVFAYPQEERNTKLVKATLKEVLESDDYKDLKDNPDVIQWCRVAINGYYQMGGRPERVQVAKITREDKEGNPVEQLGLEVFVDGKIGDTKRKVIGFIDRLTIDQSDEAKALDGESIVIEDWKTGAKAKKWNPKTKSEDGLAEARQQVIYAMLLELMNVNVSGARLIFPVAQEVVDVDLKDEGFRARVIESIEETDKALDHYIEFNTFEYKPNFLCAWCPLAKICPKADIKPFAKAREAYSKQPGPEVLVRGIQILD